MIITPHILCFWPAQEGPGKGGGNANKVRMKYIVILIVANDDHPSHSMLFGTLRRDLARVVGRQTRR